MRGVWMMSRLVPVTVTAVCPLKQRRGQKVKSDGCDRWWWYFTLCTCATPWIIHFGEMLSFYLWSSFKIIRLGQMSIRTCLLTCRCSTLAQSWWWWDPPHTQSVGLSGGEPCLCSQTQRCSRSRAKMRESCRWATDPPSWRSNRRIKMDLEHVIVLSVPSQEATNESFIIVVKRLMTQKPTKSFLIVELLLNWT